MRIVRAADRLGRSRIVTCATRRVLRLSNTVARRRIRHDREASAVSQSHGIAIWEEPTNSGANPSGTPMVLKNIGGAWMHIAGDIPDAVPIDLGDGTFVITDVTDPSYDPNAPKIQFTQVRGAVLGY
jgi:hypothetical protein